MTKIHIFVKIYFNAMRILIVNDDGYSAKGILELVDIMKPYGEITVVAPKYHQSGMSMAVSLGLRPIALKHVGMKDGVDWWYLDATPASCAKYALDVLFKDNLPDVVLSGINHGSNASTAMWYSGTIGAAREAAHDGVMSIGVSLDNLSPHADFSVVRELFPSIFEKIMANRVRKNIIYNVNFPDLPSNEIKGIKICTQGREYWIHEFVPYDPEIFHKRGIVPENIGVHIPEREEGETFLMMAGDVIGDPGNDDTTDNYANENGYIAITPHSLDNTDYLELRRLKEIF